MPEWLQVFWSSHPSPNSFTVGQELWAGSSSHVPLLHLGETTSLGAVSLSALDHCRIQRHRIPAPGTGLLFRTWRLSSPWPHTSWVTVASSFLLDSPDRLCRLPGDLECFLVLEVMTEEVWKVLDLSNKQRFTGEPKESRKKCILLSLNFTLFEKHLIWDFWILIKSGVVEMGIPSQGCPGELGSISFWLAQHPSLWERNGSPDLLEV